MVEEWKDIPNFEGYYQASTMGRIRSVERTLVYKNGAVRHWPSKVLVPYLRKDGYYSVSLSKNGVRKSYRVHRLVAETFIPNPDNLPEVNHKNEIKTDNRVENLEWCTSEYNLNWATHNIRMVQTAKKNNKHGKPIIQFTLDGKYVNEYKNTSEASLKTGIVRSTIGKVANGQRKTAGGFIWKYKD